MAQRADLTHVTAQLADWVASLRYTDLPAASVQTATDCILDSIGAAAVGASLPIAARLHALLDCEGAGTPSATVIGRAERASSMWAAFVNGCLMHAEDWDDTPHTSYYLAALLATAEELNTSGEDLIVAWVAAYEVWTHLIPALAMDRQHNPTSVVGPMVAALGAGRLHGFTTGQLQTALALGAASSSGLRANFGTLAKPFDAGNSARGGVQAARLTALGWTAEAEILEGLDGVRYRGVFDTFGGPRKDVSRVLDGLGVVFRSAMRPADGFGGGALDPATWPPRWVAAAARSTQVAQGTPEGRGAPTVKAWPACFGHNSTLTALFSIFDEPGFERGDVESIEVFRATDPTDSATFRTDPKTGLEGKFSVPFILAAGWLDGTISVDTFREDNFQRIYDSGVLQRVHVTVDRGLSDRGDPGRVSVNLKNGTSRSFPLGRGLALQRDGVVAKFVANAAPLLGREQASAVAQRITNLDREPSARDIMRAFTVDARPRWDLTDGQDEP